MEAGSAARDGGFGRDGQLVELMVDGVSQVAAESASVPWTLQRLSCRSRE